MLKYCHAKRNSFASEQQVLNVALMDDLYMYSSEICIAMEISLQ